MHPYASHGANCSKESPHFRIKYLRTCLIHANEMPFSHDLESLRRQPEEETPHEKLRACDLKPLIDHLIQREDPKEIIGRRAAHMAGGAGQPRQHICHNRIPLHHRRCT